MCPSSNTPVIETTHAPRHSTLKTHPAAPARRLHYSAPADIGPMSSSFHNTRPTVMRASRLTLLCTLLLSLLAADAVGEIVIRKSGSAWARIDDNGTIRIKGKAVGRYESNGTVRKNGSAVGSIDNNGTIRRSGSAIGRIESGGTLRRSGSAIGAIESSGTIRKKGSAWGSASNCCGSHDGKKSVAAVLVFFADDYFDN